MADSRHSFSIASTEFLRRRSDSWSRNPAIVYDSTEGKLYRVPEIEAAGYPRAIMPGKHTKADIYLEKGNMAQAWLARVDLGKLGWTVKSKRRNGEIKYVYVKTGSQNARDLQ